MDLSTTARVKAFLAAGGTSLSTGMDTVIGQLVAFYSARFERELGRWTETIERTERYDIEAGQRTITLKGYPLVAIDSIRNDTTRVFDADSEIDSTLYDVTAESGLVRFDWIEPLPGPGVLRVVYTGGMSDDGATDPTASFITNYPDIAQALDLQVAEIIRRKDRLGATNLSFQGGGIGYEAAVKLLPEVKATLDLHRRAFVR